MDQKAIEELREKYIKDPPEGMTAQLVKNMSFPFTLLSRVNIISLPISLNPQSAEY